MPFSLYAVARATSSASIWLDRRTLLTIKDLSLSLTSLGSVLSILGQARMVLETTPKTDCFLAMLKTRLHPLNPSGISGVRCHRPACMSSSRTFSSCDSCVFKSVPPFAAFESQARSDVGELECDRVFYASEVMHLVGYHDVHHDPDDGVDQHQHVDVELAEAEEHHVKREER